MIADASWLVCDGVARLASEFGSKRAIHTARTRPDLLRTLRAASDAAAVLVGADLLAGEDEFVAELRSLAPDASFCTLYDGSSEAPDVAIRFGVDVAINLRDGRERAAAELQSLLLFDSAVVDPCVATGLASHARKEPDLNVLTRREQDVFALLGAGLSVLVIADRLKMSPNTARVHVTRIMKKLDLRDRSALMHRAVSTRIGW